MEELNSKNLKYKMNSKKSKYTQCLTKGLYFFTVVKFLNKRMMLERKIAKKFTFPKKLNV